MTANLEHRHPSTQEKAGWLEPNPNLPAGVPAAVARLFRDLRDDLLEQLEDGPQLALGLQHLIDAKDCLVRQALADARR